MRAELQRNIIYVADPAERHRRRLVHVKKGAGLENLVEREILALGKLTAQVSQKKLIKLPPSFLKLDRYTYSVLGILMLWPNYSRGISGELGF